ncbi:MAG: sulfite exporter TauE/SafE family protein [Burkholderiales bacterium]|nr:sulfite exporter TauE/SafE family protein [Burkholderiales bacterium]
MTPDLALLLGGAVVAGFVQGLSGFAFSMVAMSIWVWGLDPKLAAVMAVFGSFTGQLVAAFSVRRGFDARALVPYLAGAAVGVPLGVWALPHIDPLRFKAAFGALLVLWCPAMLFSSRLPRVTAGGRWADAAAGTIGGFMGGLGGLTGVVPTLWCTLRGLAKDAQRSIIQNFNLAALGFTLLGYIASGAVRREMWPRLPLLAAAVVIPVLAGAHVYVGLSELAFRRVVLSLLALSGLALLASSLPRLL